MGVDDGLGRGIESLALYMVYLASLLKCQIQFNEVAMIYEFKEWNIYYQG